MNIIKTQTLIIGGGIHGITLAAKMHAHGIYDFLIVDGRSLASNWRRLTHAAVHENLRTSGRMHTFPAEVSYNGRNIDDPLCINCFNGLLDKTVEVFGLTNHHKYGWVEQVYSTEVGNYRVFVRPPRGNKRYQIETSRIIVAVGIGRPRYVPGLEKGHKAVVHTNNTVALSRTNWKGKSVAIVGGGLTGITVAANLALAGAEVRVYMRGTPVLSQTDVDPEWIDDNVMAKVFRETKDPLMRMQMLRFARKRSTITPAAWDRFNSIGNVSLRTNMPCRRLYQSRDGVHLVLGESIHSRGFDRVVLSTGYTMSLDTLDFLNPLRSRLPHVEGLPILKDQTLEASKLPGMYFMGRMAGLSLGPLAQNIPGAKRGAAIITSTM